jgi:hypothetical protein
MKFVSVFEKHFDPTEHPELNATPIYRIEVQLINWLYPYGSIYVIIVYKMIQFGKKIRPWGVSGVACPQGVEGSGMAGPSDTLGKACSMHRS